MYEQMVLVSLIECSQVSIRNCAHCQSISTHLDATGKVNTGGGGGANSWSKGIGNRSVE